MLTVGAFPGLDGLRLRCRCPEAAPLHGGQPRLQDVGVQGPGFSLCLFFGFSHTHLAWQPFSFQPHVLSEAHQGQLQGPLAVLEVRAGVLPSALRWPFSV